MADDVNIVGIDQLPAWATEKTMLRVLEVLSRNGVADQKTEENLEKAVNNLSNNTKEAAEALAEIAQDSKDKGEDDTGPTGGGGEDTKKSIGIFRSSIRGLSSDMADLGGGLFKSITGFESSSRHLYGFNSAVKGMTKSGGLFAKVLGGAAVGAVGLFASSLGMFIKVMMDSANVILRMNEVGLRQITSAEMLTKNLSELGMTSADFQKIMVDYSTAMGTFGMGALADLVGRSSEVNRELSKFGLTTADASQFAAEYLEQQRLSGIFDRMEDTQRRKRVLDNIKQLSAFSSILNVSRQEIAKAQTEMLRQDRIRAVLLGATAGREREQLSESIRDVTGFFAAFGKSGKAVNDMFADMVSVADPAMALENYGVALAAAPEAMSYFMETVRKINANDLGEDEGIRRSARFNMMLAENADRLSYMARITKDQATRALADQALAQEEFVSKLREDGKTTEDIIEILEERAEMESTLGQSAAQFNDAMNFVRRSVERIIIGFFNAFGGAEEGKNGLEATLDMFTEFGRGFGEFVDNFLEEAQGKGIGGFLTTAFDKIGEEIDKRLPGMIVALFAAIGDALILLVKEVFTPENLWRVATSSPILIAGRAILKADEDAKQLVDEISGTENNQTQTTLTEPESNQNGKNVPITVEPSVEENREQIQTRESINDESVRQVISDNSEALSQTSRATEDLLPVMSSLREVLENIESNTRAANDLMARMA